MKRPKKRPEGLKPVSFGSDDSGSKASSKSSGSGGKGGGKSVDPSTSKGQKAIAASRTEKSGFGYYNDAGKYVPAYIDAFDGGGMNQQGTYFAGGPLSNILNVAKVAPLGATEGLVPREEIGYRDLTDMFDQGGPQASGGGFRGAGGFSGLGNIANMLAGNESERVGYYDEGGRFYEPPAPTPAPSGILNAVQDNVSPQNYESTARQMQTMGLPNYESTGRQMNAMNRHPLDYRSQHVREAVADVFEREKERADNLGVPFEEGSDALNRYYAQKHMAYSGQPMSQLTNPSVDGIPNIDRLMPPVNAAPQAAQGIPIEPYQAKPVPSLLQLDAGPNYHATMDRMLQELGEEKFNEILMSPNSAQLIDLYERGGPFKL